MCINVLKGSVGSSSNVLLGFAVAAAIALGVQQASAQTPSVTLTENCDANIPFGTTTIHFNGTVTNSSPGSPSGLMILKAGDGTLLLGPFSLGPQSGTNYSGTFTVPVGCGPFLTQIALLQAGGETLIDIAKRAIKVTPVLSLTENCDASIPFGTTTIHVSGTVTNLDPCVPVQGVTVTISDGTTLLGPIDLAGGAGTNYSATITVPVGCGPFTNTVTATSVFHLTASATNVTTVTVCPTDITVCNDPGACGAVVAYSTGGCVIPSCTPPSGSFFPIGTTPVNCGPAAAPDCTFTVTVNACDNRCPLGLGFWKSHPSVWPVNSLTLGTLNYTQKNQLLAILKTPIGTGKMADASLLLADELIAAKLNLLNGSPACPIASTIPAADALIGNSQIPIKIALSTALGQQMMALAATLDNYNNGLLTPGCTP
jgi:hypothetical protein